MHEDIFQKLLSPSYASTSKQSQILSFTTLKELEAIEMQQEEKYISNLKLQREKISEFQEILADKEKKIKELETELKFSNAKKAENEKQASEIVGLAQNLKKLEMLYNEKAVLLIN